MIKLRKFIRSQGFKFLEDPNITSIGIGYKSKNGKPTKEISIQFTVDSKVQPEKLEALKSTPIPESLTIDGEEFPTDVIQRKFTVDYHLVNECETDYRKTRQDTVSPGISVSNKNGTAGTIGCLVFDNTTGIPYILSNWHVLHGSKGNIGDTVVQPGPYDDNRVDENEMGKLVRSHIGPAGDCAIASIKNRKIDLKIFEIGVTVEKLGEPLIGDKVIKSGRTTGVTHGIVTRVDVMSKIPFGGNVGEKTIGGFEIQVDPNFVPSNGEISMGGDSGSVWLFKTNNDKASNTMAGLHFAGESSKSHTEFALACYPKSVFKKLDITLTSKINLDEINEEGFSKNFLSKKIEPPTLSSCNKKIAFPKNGSSTIDHTHFSLVMNKTRRFAIWVGWNIDGAKIKRLPRKGFKLDPKIPDEYQIDNSLYKYNLLDRGHIARRADLNWGTIEEAKKANSDSFYYTNIAPQMEDFNQSRLNGIWGNLENAVFDETDVEDLRVSIFSGPVFQEDDREYRGIKIPREYWKVIMFVENHELKVKGFILTQNLNQLEALDLDEFRVYQTSLTEIEDRCGISFSKIIKSADSMNDLTEPTPETMNNRHALESIHDIKWN